MATLQLTSEIGPEAELSDVTKASQSGQRGSCLELSGVVNFVLFFYFLFIISIIIKLTTKNLQFLLRFRIYFNYSES